MQPHKISVQQLGIKIGLENRFHANKMSKSTTQNAILMSMTCV
jgi:hypothetical protein